MIVSIFFIALSISISIFSIGYVILHKSKYFNHLLFLVLTAAYYSLDISFIFTFSFSTIYIFSENIALSLWKTSIILLIIKSSIMSAGHGYILLKSRIKILPGFFYSLLGGLIISLLYFGSTFDIRISGLYYRFIFQNTPFLILLISYILIINILVIYVQCKEHTSISSLKLRKFFISLLILFFINNTFFIVYLIIQIQLLRIIFLSIYFLLSCYILIMIINKPDLFLVITNRIFDFIIFHKSGILLYSFNFETDQETDESLLKGSILIGINHILNSFIDKKDKLNVIKMKEKDLLLEYDSEFGYALLLIARHKNSVMERAVQQFILKFNEYFKKSLTKIREFSQLIDISEFKDTKLIINEVFAPYMTKK